MYVLTYQTVPIFQPFNAHTKTEKTTVPNIHAASGYKNKVIDVHLYKIYASIVTSTK